MSHFRFFPTTTYRRQATDFVLENGERLVYDIKATDILVRYKIRQAVLDNDALFYPYLWADSDRVDTVAFEYYGSSSLYWLVMYSNGAFDLNYDFPLPAATFNRYLEEKYKEIVIPLEGFTPFSWELMSFDQRLEKVLAYLANTIHSRRFYFVDDPMKKYDASLKDYLYYTGGGYAQERAAYALEQTALGTDLTLPDAIGEEINIYAYEDELNEAKRKVQVIDADYYKLVVQELNNDLARINTQKQLLGDI